MATSGKGCIKCQPSATPAARMGRREFVSLLGGAVAAWPLAIRAQVSTRKPLIGILSAVTRVHNIPLDALVHGLQELGYVEGRSADFAFRFAEGKLDRLPALVEELVRLTPDVIVVGVTPAAVAARALTRTIPIVCPLLADPIGFGLIASESHPGGNVTGVLFRTEGLAGKQVELALQLIPNMSKVGLLVNVATGVIIDRHDAESASKTVDIKLIPAEVRKADDLLGAFEALANEHVQAVIVLVDGMFFNERGRIAALAEAMRIPAIYGFRDHVDAGGLISYGVNLAENFHRAATYVHKILKGAKPGDLPVEFPTKLELVINLKTAKALGITIPPSVLARADEVIE
jgi:putative tryptophan/tyrosine transport system substrate-binding protein